MASVTLAWASKATDTFCTGVHIYRSLNPDGSEAAAVAGILSKSVVTYKDLTAVGPQTYYYYATAVYPAVGGGNVESAPSNIVQANVPAPPMTPPQNLVVTAVE